MGESPILGVTRELSSFVHQLRYEQIPGPVVEHAKGRVLEVIGLCFAGYKWERAGRIVAETVLEERGRGESTMIGFGVKAPAARAALVNGVTSQSMQFCDIHMPRSGIHPSVCIVPAVLAIGEANSVSGREVITAVVAGIEAITRIGHACTSSLLARGFYATSACGTFAAALAAGKLLGLAPDALADSMGIAGTMTAGSMEFQSNGSQAHQLNAGWAAQNGILAARLAGRGFTGPHTALEGPLGFYKAFAGDGNYDLSLVTRDLGERWEILNVVSKPYPVCALSQPCMEAALNLKRRHHLTPDEITDVCCHVTPHVVSLVCEPKDVKYDPPTPYGAKFSLPYSVALAVCKGEICVDQYAEGRFRDPEVLALAKKVRYVVEPARPPHSGKVDITLRNGLTWEEEVLQARVTPGNAPTVEEVVEKYRKNTAGTLSREKAGEVLSAVGELQNLPDINTLTKLLL